MTFPNRALVYKSQAEQLIRKQKNIETITTKSRLFPWLPKSNLSTS